MKFTCKCSLLRQEIEYASNFASKKNSLSISSNVLLEVSNELLTIKAYDQQMGFISSIPVSVSVPGSTTVFCEKLSNVLKNTEDVDIEVFEDNGILNIRPVDNENFSANMKTIEASRFPELESIDDSLLFSVTQRDFIDMIDKTSFAVAGEDNRHFLTGVYMENKEDRLVMVATDGKRLACVKRQFEQEIPEFRPCIMSVRFLSMLKSISTGEGVLSLAVKEGLIFSRIGDRTIYSALIAGNYPNYEKVIPKNLEYKCVVRTEDLEKAVSFTSIFVDEKSRRIFVEISNEKIDISGESTDIGDSRQSISCEYSGPDIRITFNSSLLHLPIKKIDSEFMKIMFRSESAALTISPEPDKDYLYVLMPMQN